MSERDNLTEEEFLAQYDMSKFTPTAVTVDLAIFTIRNNALSILLVKRGGHPFKGSWALPGGFKNPSESLSEAASRELEEETGLSRDGQYLEQLKTYGDPGRDPRGHIISTAYVALSPVYEEVQGMDDADDAKFFPVDDVLSEGFDLAFDHKQIIEDGLERVRAKLEYSPIAHHFLKGDHFTMTELRTVYEIVWGERLTPSNFRRKMLQAEGVVEVVGGKISDGVGRPSDIYKAGDAEIIFPPLKRSKF